MLADAAVTAGMVTVHLVGANCAPNTGSAGSGGGGSYHVRGAGADGVVILSIPANGYTGIYTGSPIITTVGNNTILKFTSAGTYTC